MRKLFSFIALAAMVLSAPTAAFARGGGSGGALDQYTVAVKKMRADAEDAACKKDVIKCNGSNGIKYWGASYGMVIPAAYK